MAISINGDRHDEGIDNNRSDKNNNAGDEDDDDLVEISMLDEVHKVVLPPKRSTVKKLKMRFKETFFPDDPFRHFKGVPLRTKWVLGLQYVFPIFGWAPNYTLSLFRSDLISGLTIASLAIPQGISYAKLANLPPIIGLCKPSRLFLNLSAVFVFGSSAACENVGVHVAVSSFVPPLVYAVLGSSRDLAVGPTSIASLLMGSMLQDVVSPGTDEYLRLAFTSTLFAGVFQAALGILRLGFIVDFLSTATLVGFMAGAAIIVSLQQLKGLLGIVNFTKKMGLVPVMSSVFHRTDEVGLLLPQLITNNTKNDNFLCLVVYLIVVNILARYSCVTGVG